MTWIEICFTLLALAGCILNTRYALYSIRLWVQIHALSAAGRVEHADAIIAWGQVRRNIQRLAVQALNLYLGYVGLRTLNPPGPLTWYVLKYILIFMTISALQIYGAWADERTRIEAGRVV